MATINFFEKETYQNEENVANNAKQWEISREMIHDWAKECFENMQKKHGLPTEASPSKDKRQIPSPHYFVIDGAVENGDIQFLQKAWPKATITSDPTYTAADGAQSGYRLKLPSGLSFSAYIRLVPDPGQENLPRSDQTCHPVLVYGSGNEDTWKEVQLQVGE
jgi:hypothetical protein